MPTISIPPGKNYPSPLVALPSFLMETPNEGNKLIPCQIDWASQGGANKCVFFNLQNNATLEFRSIRSLSIDNSASGADVEFIFPDTGETTLIPAYAPKVILPIISNQTQFYVVGYGVQPQDITRFSILNFLPPPIAVPVTEEQSVAAISNVATDVAGSAAIIPPSVSGTLEGLQLLSIPNAAAASNVYFNFTIQDGDSNLIALANDWGAPGVQPPRLVFQNNSMRVRFHNGVSITWTVTGTPGGSSKMAVNAYYRTP